MVGNGHPIIEGAIPVEAPAYCCEEFKRTADESEFGDVVWTFRIKYYTVLGEECCFLCPYCGAEFKASFGGEKNETGRK